VPERMRIVIIGAGHAGLAVSHELESAGLEHVILERARVGQSWRTRWDSFCLVTPNWTVQLPGGAYRGAHPDGFMPRDDIVGHLENYAAKFRAPVREGVNVTSVEPARGGGLLLRTSSGDSKPTQSCSQPVPTRSRTGPLAQLHFLSGFTRSIRRPTGIRRLFHRGEC
jgi:cation diffusion facilitator CzcD-associated flavoprotein CzcO